MRSQLEAYRPRADCIFKNRDGVAAVEFAVLAPIYLWLVLMVMQIGLYFYYSATLQRATDAAIRQVLVGNVANSSLTQTQFLNQILCPQIPMLNCSNVVVNFVDAPASFTSLTNAVAATKTTPAVAPSGLTAPTMNNSKTSFCIGGNGAVMVAEVFYAMPVLGIPAFAGSPTYNGQLVIWIQADNVFKNEPFSTTYSGC